MEGEVKINGSDSGSLIEKIKSHKNLIIVCSVVLGIFICYLYFRSGPSEHYDYLIVGSGLYGATFNYLAKKAGKTTYIVERRNVVGGNLYCENVEGIWIHKYGPHVFHTDNKKVWDFVNNMTHFNPYIQQTVAKVEDKLYSLPFNMWTFYELWGVQTPEEAQKKIEEQKYTGEVHNLEEQAMSLVGKDVYEKLIKGYTEKQWGRECKNLPPFIIKRLPTRFTYDSNYFNDRYQGIPEGCYNAMMEQLLKDTKIETGVDYNKNKEKYEKIDGILKSKTLLIIKALLLLINLIKMCLILVLLNINILNRIIKNYKKRKKLLSVKNLVKSGMKLKKDIIR